MEYALTGAIPSGHDMKRKWYTHLVFFSERDGNILEVLGALLVMISFALPFFEKTYRQSSSFISGFELILPGACRGLEITSFMRFVSIYLLLIPILMLSTSLRKSGALMALVGLILLAVMLTITPVPVERFSSGIFLLITGLSLIGMSIFKKGGSTSSAQGDKITSS
jgi:hypothetical protein